MKFSLKSFLTALVISSSLTNFMSSPGKAASFDNVAFIDNFDDGLVNSSLYSPIGDATIEELNGQMIVSGLLDDGIEIDFSSVLPANNWMGFDFELGEGFGGMDSASLEFRAVEDLVEPSVLFSSIDNGLRTKVTIAIFDRETGDPVGGIKGVIEKVIDTEIKNITFVNLDWRLVRRRDATGKRIFVKEWIVERFGTTTRDKEIKNLGKDTAIWVFPTPVDPKNPPIDQPKEIRIKFIPTVGDPVIAFNSISADPDPAHPIPEHTSTLSLLALTTLGAGSTLLRKKHKAHH